MKITIYEIRLKQLKFYNKLIACLRGFTEHDMRPLSCRYQNKIGDWFKSLKKAEAKEQSIRYSLVHCSDEQSILSKQIEEYNNSQVSI